LIALVIATPVFAVDRYDPPLNTSGDLLEWCQQESQAAFIGEGITPFNWGLLTGTKRVLCLSKAVGASMTRT